MKPLTIEELKALKVGDWVWVVFPTVPNLMESAYIRKSPSSDDSRLYDGLDVDDEGEETFLCYSDYGKTWQAWKNKEQAEAKGEIVELPCKVGDEIYFVRVTCEPNVVKTFVDEICFKEDSILVHCAESGRYLRFEYNMNIIENYWNVYFTKKEAERRLAELKGEKP